MSQGLRRGWIRTTLAALGAVVVAGFVGCTDIDKPKDATRIGANGKAGAYLPGTPRLPGSPGSGIGAAPVGTNAGNQFGSPAGTGSPQAGGIGRTPSGTGFGNMTMPVGNSSVVPPVGPMSHSGTGPSAVSPAGANWNTPSNPAAGLGQGQSLGDPGLYPPAAPGTSGGPVAPPGVPLGGSN